MADLIFRGVKNPANCSECFFWSICPCLADFDDYSAILDAVHDGNLVRHEGCPVSPLPKGHGDLIDRDALKKRTPMVIDYSAGGFGTDGSIRPVRGYGDWQIDQAPTIIPAEGGGAK